MNVFIKTASSVEDDFVAHGLREIMRCDFTSFIGKVFDTVNPGSQYQHNWHIDLVAEYLEACRNKEITRLIINLPPRCLKSVSVSVAWPAYLLGQKPDSRILAASYVSSLSLKHSLDCRLVMQSAWYRALFPKTQLCVGQKEKAKFLTTQRGYRFATSLGASAIGEGGNFLIVDDPQSPTQAYSPLYREYAARWFDSTFSTRLDDKRNGVIVIVMQRLHPNDLTGHLLERGGWEHLIIPAISEQKTLISFGPVMKVREPDELLQENRENIALIERARQDLGSFGFAAQYQQQPLLPEGGIIKLKWLKYYDSLPAERKKTTQSWDTAIKIGSQNDASVCITFVEQENAHYIIDVLVEKLEYPELKRTILKQAERWKPDAILIEDKASGQSLLQDLKRETNLPFIAIHPSGSKVARLAAVSPLIEAGKLFLPHYASWRAQFEAELMEFPNAAHDDQVDALTQYLQWAKARGWEQLRIRRL